MQGSGKTYDYSGETTEWEDILIKKGITTKDSVLLSKGLNPLDFIKEPEVIEDEEAENALDNYTLEELDELEDDDEFADSRVLDEYRQQRLKELKQQTVRNRFGELIEIVKDDWMREVTEGSNSCPVVVHLYENSLIECQVMDEALTRLAAKFKYIKFLRIKYTQAIENWPEKNLPTLFIYENGSLKTQLITLNSVGGKTMNSDDLEWFLACKNVINDSELEEDPRTTHDRKQVTKSTVFTSSSLRNGLDSDDDI